MSEHASCILAIVGSRDCHISAGDLIDQIIAAHHPLAIISGGAKVRASDRMKNLVSIDELAISKARALGIPFSEIVPTNWVWLGAGGIKERNMKVAEGCTCLVRIGSTTSKTYGSGWTADYAEQVGKEVSRFIIDEHGAVSIGNAKPPEPR